MDRAALTGLVTSVETGVGGVDAKGVDPQGAAGLPKERSKTWLRGKAESCKWLMKWRIPVADEQHGAPFTSLREMVGPSQ